LIATSSILQLLLGPLRQTELWLHYRLQRTHGGPCLDGGGAAPTRPLPQSLQISRYPPPAANRQRRLMPRAPVLPRLLQNLQVPALGGPLHVISPHGQSCSRSHLNASRCPPSAASAQQSLSGSPCPISSSQGHPQATGLNANGSIDGH